MEEYSDSQRLQHQVNRSLEGFPSRERTGAPVPNRSREIGGNFFDWRGLLKVLALALGACGAMVGLVFMAYYAIGASVVLAGTLVIGVPVALALLLVATLLIPFILGSLIDPYGWLVGPSAVTATMFLYGPLAFSGFTGDTYAWQWHGLPPVLWALLLFIPVSVVGGWMGHQKAEKRGRARFEFKNPYASVIPVVAFLLVLTVAGMPISNVIIGNRTKRVTFEKLRFEMTIPQGWKQVDLPSGGSIPSSFVGSVDLETRGTRHSLDHYVTVSVWSELPFSDDNRTFNNFPSDQQAFDQMESDIEGRSSKGITVEGISTVGGKRALKTTSNSGTFPVAIFNDYYVVSRPYYYVFAHCIGTDSHPPDKSSAEFKQEQRDFETMVKSVRFAEPRPTPDE